MTKSHLTIGKNEYLSLLFKKVGVPLFLVLLTAVFYTVSMTLLDHSAIPFVPIVVTLALIKTGIISHVTLRRVSKLIVKCHSIEHLIWTFGLLILITLISFSTDFTCIYQSDPNSFRGLNESGSTYIDHLSQFAYFSVVTFSTLGFGDITPVTGAARLLVVLEVFLSFLIIVFSLANIKKVHLDE